VLEDLMPLAEAKHIDIGVEGTLDAEVWASELDMIAVVKNLVDNAIRYTPEGGRVDLSVGVSEGKVDYVFRTVGLAFRWLNGIECLIPSTARWGASRSARVWDYPLSRRLPIASVLKSASTSQIKRSKLA
jgi:signal transduction histidine kinase